ncbi:unnamed protein product [Amoebophrya sp. A120]|nr:unnamed protein product [Amoebophrya sp. A120]|eukprot:GSA120T00005772001.1
MAPGAARGCRFAIVATCAITVVSGFSAIKTRSTAVGASAKTSRRAARRTTATAQVARSSARATQSSKKELSKNTAVGTKPAPSVAEQCAEDADCLPPPAATPIAELEKLKPSELETLRGSVEDKLAKAKSDFEQLQAKLAKAQTEHAQSLQALKQEIGAKKDQAQETRLATRETVAADAAAGAKEEENLQNLDGENANLRKDLQAKRAAVKQLVAKQPCGKCTAHQSTAFLTLWSSVRDAPAKDLMAEIQAGQREIRNLEDDTKALEKKLVREGKRFDERTQFLRTKVDEAEAKAEVAPPGLAAEKSAGVRLNDARQVRLKARKAENDDLRGRLDDLAKKETRIQELNAECGCS